MVALEIHVSKAADIYDESGSYNSTPAGVSTSSSLDFVGLTVQIAGL